MFKRAYLSVTRRKNKTIILGIILFVIANLVLSSITITNATEEAMDYARQSLGSTVSLTTDLEAMRSETETNMNERGQGFERLSVASPTYGDVSLIADSNYVTDYSYGFSYQAVATDFNPVGEDTEEETTNDMQQRTNQISGDVTIQSINAFALVSGVIDGSIELIEGNAFDEESEDEVVISYDLAMENDLAIGDTIEIETITREEDGISLTLTIVGIYDTLTEDSDNFMIDPANTVYVNIDSGLLLMGESEMSNDVSVSNVNFYINDPLNIEAFIEEGNLTVTDLTERYLMLDSNDEDYETMVGPIEGVASTSSTILIGVMIAAIVILSLLIVNQIKDRNYEIGVLLSLGEKRAKIAGQLLTELLIVATVAFGLSIITASFISDSIGENLLASQLEMEEESSTSNSSFGGRGQMSFNNKASDVEAIDELELKTSTSEFLTLFGLGYGIIILSLIIPTTQILKYEPKTILTRKDG